MTARRPRGGGRDTRPVSGGAADGSAGGLLLRRGALGLGGSGGWDVRVGGGVVTEVGRGLAGAGEEVVDCRGLVVVPGLCDHHVHVLALAAWRRSVPCGPPEARDRGELARALRGAVADAGGWVRGVGYVESVAGELDAAALDDMRADVPVRVQHRSGALWMLNSAALRAVGDGDHPGIERDGRGEPTGRLWRADGWLRERLPDAPPDDLAGLGRELAWLGITALTDATPDLGGDAVRLLTSGGLPQRLHLLGAAEDPGIERVTVGPRKIVIADSGPPDFDALCAGIAAAHAAGRAVAVHCVSYEAIALLTAALATVGPLPGDRVEHGALIPAGLLPDLKRLGVAVVTQPGFLYDRGDDYLRDVPETERPDLYRCASPAAAGIPLALSSDAPYGPADPWTVIDAAVLRRTRTGAVLGAAERLDRRAAIAAYLAPPGNPGGEPPPIAPGLRADLALLPADLSGPPAMTIIDGRPVS